MKLKKLLIFPSKNLDNFFVRLYLSSKWKLLLGDHFVRTGLEWCWIKSTGWRILFRMYVYLETIGVSFFGLFLLCYCNELKYTFIPIICGHEKKFTCPWSGCYIVTFVVNVISNHEYPQCQVMKYYFSLHFLEIE